MKIYTKTGDKGKTSLFDGTRVYKNDLRVESYGTIDELNAILGIVLAEVRFDDAKFKKNLVEIQSTLFEIGANLANPQKKEDEQLAAYLEKQTKEIETYIDELTTKMPELTHFILPGGSKIGSFLQLARTVSRRAERIIVSLSQQEHVSKEILIYLNRLSDLFHTMSRYSNMLEKKKEIIWESKTN